MSNSLIVALQVMLFIIFAPMLHGFVKWTKSRLQNRCGPSILQSYRDLRKLFRKDMSIVGNASIIFKVTPLINFAVLVVICSVVPLVILDGHTNFVADVIVIIGLFALMRFFLVLAGMDIGTAFGGMGSSREMMIAALAEPALLMAFFALAINASSTNLSVITNFVLHSQTLLRPSLIFACLGFVLIALAETGRIPIDNPATHLELTMIHEAMILEYSGRNLALLEWSAQIKFMLYCVIFCDLFFPLGLAKDITFYAIAAGVGALVVKLLCLSCILVLAETNLAKLRLFRAPYLLSLAFLLCLLGVLSHIILEVN